MSEHVKLAVANPYFTRQIAKLPDRTEHQRLGLFQGDKYVQHNGMQ
jgi:hypothetical protein